MFKVETYSLGGCHYFGIVLVRENLIGELETQPTGLGLWINRGEAQSVCDKRNQEARQ
jgi:hypothetical protein